AAADVAGRGARGVHGGVSLERGRAGVSAVAEHGALRPAPPLGGARATDDAGGAGFFDAEGPAGPPGAAAIDNADVLRAAVGAGPLPDGRRRRPVPRRADEDGE